MLAIDVSDVVIRGIVLISKKLSGKHFSGNFYFKVKDGKVILFLDELDFIDLPLALQKVIDNRKLV